MILPSSATSLRVVTTTAAAVGVVVAYDDLYDQTTHGLTRPGVAVASIASATTTTVVSGSADARARRLRDVIVTNADASLSDGVTIGYHDGSTLFTLWKGTLAPGESVRVADDGVVVFNSSGVPKAAPVSGVPQSSVLVSPLFATANLSGTRSITSTNTYAVYLGRAPRALTSLSLRYRVTTGAATITWAELAIAKGAVNIGGGPTLTVVGYADVSGVVTGTGQFTTAVNVSAGQTINEGDDVWALYGNNASTVTVLRAQSIADDLQAGVFAYLSTRPSTNVGNAQAYNVDGAGSTAPWIVGVV